LHKTSEGWEWGARWKEIVIVVQKRQIVWRLIVWRLIVWRLIEDPEVSLMFAIRPPSPCNNVWINI